VTLRGERRAIAYDTGPYFFLPLEGGGRRLQAAGWGSNINVRAGCDPSLGALRAPSLPFQGREKSYAKALMASAAG